MYGVLYEHWLWALTNEFFIFESVRVVCFTNLKKGYLKGRNTGKGKCVLWSR